MTPKPRTKRAKAARKFVLRVMVTTEYPMTRTQVREAVQDALTREGLGFWESARVTTADIP